MMSPPPPRDGAGESAPSKFALPASPAARRVATSGLVLVVGIFAAVRLLGVYPWSDRIFDLWAYWSTRYGLDYATARPGEAGDYLYSPAFAHLIAPLTALPLPIFAALWTIILAAVLYWLAGWRAFYIGLLVPVLLSIGIGQTDLLMAAVIVIGFRWPAAWFLPIVTKLTPGIGVLWFAVRREWRSFGIALGTTFAVAAVSFAIDPEAWLGWFAMLARLEFPTPGHGHYLPVPVWVRLPLVALLIVWGARANRRWTLPIAVCFALPTVWINTPAILAAIPALIDWGADAPAGRWVRATGATAETAAHHLHGRATRARLAFRRDLTAFVAWAVRSRGPRAKVRPGTVPRARWRTRTSDVRRR